MVAVPKDPAAQHAMFHGLAYVLLFAQEQQKDPTLTPAKFRQWLLDVHKANYAEAVKQHKAKLEKLAKEKQ